MSFMTSSTWPFISTSRRAVRCSTWFESALTWFERTMTWFERTMTWLERATTWLVKLRIVDRSALRRKFERTVLARWAWVIRWMKRWTEFASVGMFWMKSSQVEVTFQETENLWTRWKIRSKTNGWMWFFLVSFLSCKRVLLNASESEPYLVR